MTNDLIEKLKNAKTRDEVDALIKTTMGGKVALSIDDLSSVTGGQYDPVNNPLPEEMKPVLLELVRAGMRDVAATILLDYYGVDYNYYYYQKVSVFGSDEGVMMWLLDRL